MPKRIRLSRKKGWRLPKNAVNISRSGNWGNPFIIGKHGDRARCVDLFLKLCGGFTNLSVDEECFQRQRKFIAHALRNIHRLRGKNLACWCPVDGQPCHGDVLLKMANPKAMTTLVVRILENRR